MTYKSDAFESIHQSATALHKVGTIDETTMQEFDKSCLIAPAAQGLTDELMAKVRTRLADKSKAIEVDIDSL